MSTVAGTEITLPCIPEYSSVVSVGCYDLTGVRFAREVLEYPDDATAQTGIEAYKSSANKLQMFIEGSGGTLTSRVRTNDSNNETQITYDPEDHKWLAISVSGSNVLFQASADGESWVTIRTVAVPAQVDVTNVKLGMWCGYWGSETSPIDGVFDARVIGLEPLELVRPSTLVFNDDFALPFGQPPDSNKWTFQTGGGGWGNDELQYFTDRDDNCQHLGDGTLAIIAREESFGGEDYTSARIYTKDKFSFTYGHVEARLKVPADQGLWTAFWTMGDDVNEVGWPLCGEMDIVEVADAAGRVGYGTLHGPVGVTETPWAHSFSGYFAPITLADDYHVYGMTWTEDTIEWSFDGAVYERIKESDLAAGNTWVFDDDFHLILHLSVGGTFPGSPDETTNFPATLLADWVRVYQ